MFLIYMMYCDSHYFDVVTLSLLLWNVNFQPAFFTLHSACGPNSMYILHCCATIPYNSIQLSCDVLTWNWCL